MPEFNPDKIIWQKAESQTEKEQRAGKFNWELENLD